MQKAQKAGWLGARIYGSKDVPWRIQCKRLVERSKSTAFPALSVKLGDGVGAGVDT